MYISIYAEYIYIYVSMCAMVKTWNMWLLDGYGDNNSLSTTALEWICIEGQQFLVDLARKNAGLQCGAR